MSFFSNSIYKHIKEYIKIMFYITTKMNIAIDNRTEGERTIKRNARYDQIKISAIIHKINRINSKIHNKIFHNKSIRTTIKVGKENT